jgi:hypothetical protein
LGQAEGSCQGLRPDQAVGATAEEQVNEPLDEQGGHQGIKVPFGTDTLFCPYTSKI